jgi:multimeric flavodoxin WrbA
MKAIVLNGFAADPPIEGEQRIATALAGLLADCPFPVARFDTAAMAIAPCTGCFACWVRTPGHCVIRDDQEAIVASLAACELRILLTPVTFGGYGYHLKKAMDRSIPVLLPFFRRFRGEVHHPQRYPGERKLLVVGSDGHGNAAQNDTFREVVRRNALNMQINNWTALTIPLDSPQGAIVATVGQALDKMEVPR